MQSGITSALNVRNGGRAMAEVLLVLFVALMPIGWYLIWLHDTSTNPLWQRNVWAATGLCSVVVGAFGTIYTMGKVFGGVLG